MGTIKCYALKSERNGLHCPLSTETRPLELTFNYQVRQEKIVEVEIDDTFVCQADEMSMCEHCPFKHHQKVAL